ncbi:MAG: hypothetical protein WBE58_09900 [Verrucomicrobiales bacterium]
MPSLRIIVTGCRDAEFSAFLRSRPSLGRIECESSADRKLTCTLPEESMEPFFETLREQAEKSWSDPDDDSLLAFDCAYFPNSLTQFQPMRQLRGRVAARMARQMKNLPPARAVPLTVFGPEEED